MRSNNEHHLKDKYFIEEHNEVIAGFKGGNYIVIHYLVMPRGSNHKLGTTMLIIFKRTGHTMMPSKKNIY